MFYDLFVGLQVTNTTTFYNNTSSQGHFHSPKRNKKSWILVENSQVWGSLAIGSCLYSGFLSRKQSSILWNTYVWTWGCISFELRYGFSFGQREVCFLQHLWSAFGFSLFLLPAHILTTNFQLLTLWNLMRAPQSRSHGWQPSLSRNKQEVQLNAPYKAYFKKWILENISPAMIKKNSA